MADYRSTLTGTQMDSALLDMAEHNSEAYAVGERNGIAVASDDVTYHNNARYYAQIASSQIVGDASSAVRWDTDQSEVLTDAQKAQARENINAASDSDVVKITAQTLTSAQQAQARANIMAGGSNRNLLDNPWFTVNQRGASGSISTPNQYGYDRWKKSGSGGSILLADNCITPSNGGGFWQILPWDSIVDGATYTVSAMTYGGSVYSATGTLRSSGSGWQISVHLIPNALWVGMRKNAAGQLDVLFTGQDGTAKVKAVKLEKGSVSTLANDAPPDYGEELSKCQRYFIRLNTLYATIGSVYCMSATSVLCCVPLPTTLRAIPTVAHTGVYVLARSFLPVTNIVVQNQSSMSANAITLTATVSGATPDQAGLLQIRDSGGYIDLSADL